MMAYIQIFAIVLCSCFIQDVFSETKSRKGPTVSTNDSMALPSADVGGQAAVKPPLRRPTTVKRTASRKARATPPPAPPAKYPHLTAVKDMFWNTLEEINRDSVNGKLNIRSVRNTLDNVLSNELFWSSIVGMIKSRVKETNDSKRADSKIRMCNMLTTAITSPNSTQGFQDVADEVYDTVSRIQSDVGTSTLQLVTEMVDGGEVTNGLKLITDAVKHIDLNPNMLIKGFAMFQKTLNLGGTINMGGGLAKGLMTISSNLNK